MRKVVGLIAIIILSINMISCKVSEMQKEINKLEDIQIFTMSEDGTAIILDGTINSSALKQFKALFEKNPNVNTLRIINCDGSINDDVNLKLAKFVHDKGLNTFLEEDGLVASGGTDLFLAGKERSRGENTRFGVHSWGGESRKGELITAVDFPRDHKNHQPYIKYYVEIGLSQQQSEDFYFFTINAASANDIYWMTDEEIIKYNMTTKPMIINKINDNIEKDLLGKWKLKAIKVNGNLLSPEELVGLEEAYQIYEIESKFTGIVGPKSDKGTWELSEDKKNIIIRVGDVETKYIIKLKDGKMLLGVMDGTQYVIIIYTKK